MRNNLKIFLFFVLLTTGFGCTALQEEDPKAEEAAIWALEQAYFEYNRDADYEKIVDSWHDRFLGWPASEPKPIDKEEGTRYVRRSFKAPGSFTFEIEPAGILVKGNIAINHYTVHTTTKNDLGREEKTSMRIIHTWIKEDGRWKVLGGMSSSQ